MPTKWFPPNPGDIDLIIAAYDDGIGIRGIAEQFNVSPRPIERIVLESGRKLRNRSEQQFARMGRATFAERKALAAAAHAAKRGRPNSETAQLKMAAARCRRVGPLEAAVLESLEQAGIDCEQQFPIGKYNCDLLCKIDPWTTTPSIAVEVWGGGWHFHGKHRDRFPERTKYILGSGYSVAFLAIMNEFIWNDRAAENLITHLDALSRLPAGICQYRMIWGDSDYVTIGGLDDVEKALITPTVNRRDPATGRYERVPR
jgi:very-short-patch-repair endonuclease